MAKKRSIKEVETSKQSNGVQPKKKKTKKVGINLYVALLCLYVKKLKFKLFIFRESGQTSNACWCFPHVV